MQSRRSFTLLKVVAALAVMAWGADGAFAQKAAKAKDKKVKVTHAERKAAAARAAAKGFELTTLAAAEAAAPGEAPRYFSHPNYANSPLPLGSCSNDSAVSCFSDVHCLISDVQGTCTGKSGGIRKFVDGLPGLGQGAANNLGQYIPIAEGTTTQVNGIDVDYYEIDLVEYTERMHSDLPPTTLRGYMQPGKEPHYLGPAIVAQKGKPVVIKFTNKLPTGADGNLFIPVDTTVMGSGMGPMMGGMEEMDPQNPMCGQEPKPAGCYAENRATLHLHGGVTPWISDGTPHQWITPAGEDTSYPQGVSVRNVPGLNMCGSATDGCQTFWYSNQQSARLMFYHDHAWGITRLNVYAGEAAPYIIQDDAEAALVAAGTIPGLLQSIPLVIQDKTFVPKDAQLALQDETWDKTRWGGEGNQWLPHVYSPAQNPGDSSGVNQFGRWAYGPWFWPPTSDIKHGPIANAHFDPACDPDVEWCEPPLMPGTPFLSMGMESFHDTPVVNGTAYPYVEVPAGPVRFRILNAANDRFFNLSLYKADAASPTEVQLNPAEVAAALDDPTVFPTPVAGTEGPTWVQIGTEGGFLPAPVDIPPQPITWVTDPTVFNAGNVDKHSLLLAPAERADVIVDFSGLAGQTLILYNDAPAAFPARDPRYDYYTGNGDFTDTGGASSTLPGYGPNTRTVMQIRVVSGSGGPFNRGALDTAFSSTGMGVFKNHQHPIIVGQGAYNSAYGTTFQNNGPNAGLVQIFNTSFSFKTLAGGAGGTSLTMPLQPKQIQDEMGEAFDREYGRMSGFLGVEAPNPQAGLQNMILYPFVHPPTEVIDASLLPKGMTVSPIASANDGSQIWKITHNGVDTHPIHFHLYDVQLVNRVGWDGIIRKPDLNELGWKDTVRVSPLEDTIVALRPIIPTAPFDLPNSIRPLSPMMPDGFVLDSSSAQDAAGKPMFAFAPDGEPIDVFNHDVNFGWEYVWHCHILSHEEMDMMRSVAVAVPPIAPSGLVATRVGNGNNRRVDLSWMDNSQNDTAFSVQRATSATGPWTTLVMLPSASGTTTGTRTWSDPIGNTNQTFYYQVSALNVVGDTWDYSDPNLNEIPPGGGFPTKTVSSLSDVATFAAAPAVPTAPSSVVATAFRVNNRNDRVTVTWTDNANNETGFRIQRATNAAFTAGLVTSTVGANVTTFTTGNVPRFTDFYFRVQAYNATGPSAHVNASPFPVTTP